MKTRFRCDDDDWRPDGRKITDAENLEAIRTVLTSEGPIILEHWFYRGSCAPDRFIFDDFDELVTYLSDHTFAGDAIHVWSFASACTNDNTLAYGKCPDENGLVPKRGAY